jgi:hypothetical protein
VRSATLRTRLACSGGGTTGGGGLSRQAAAGQLSDVTELISHPYPAPLRRRLLSVASLLALTIGSMSADSGDTSAAYRYLGAAMEAAREACNPELGARAVNAIARRMLDDGNKEGAPGLLRHARASLRALPGEMTALLATSEAWACAAMDDYQQMAPCLTVTPDNADDAGTLFRPAVRRNSPAELAGISGACYEALASRPGSARARYAALAEQHISDALRLRQPCPRAAALDLAGLANVRLCEGEPAEAARIATDALNTAARLRSGRATRRVHCLAVRARRLPEGPRGRAVRWRGTLTAAGRLTRREAVHHAVDSARPPDDLRQPVAEPGPRRRRAARRAQVRAARRPHGPARRRDGDD